jgi:hypothetical protein
MADLGIWVVSRGGGAPESRAPAVEMAQAQKDAMAPHQQQHPPLFLDFAHGGNRIKLSSPWLLAVKRFRCVLLSDGKIGCTDD